MEDEERGGGSIRQGPTLFKKKVKSRGSTSLSTASSRTSLLTSNEQRDNNEKNGQEDQEEEEEVAVRRTAGIGSRGKVLKESKVKRQRAPLTSALSFGEDRGDGVEPAFELKKSALAQANRKMRSDAGEDVGGLPDSLEQANINGASNGYSSSALAALKASTPARRREIEKDGDMDLAHQIMIDPSTQYDEHGDALARLKFGADFVHDGIPSEALVSAAKERRRRAAEEDEEIGSSKDFISLRDDHVDDEPHPESRLQREEDDFGSGEDEFAEFTGATERVALGQRAIKEAKLRERQDRREAMDLDDDSDDSGKEWERAQMRRIEGVVSRKQREKREKSPFRPAPIPMTAPLPTLTSTSARLAVRVSALDLSIKSHGQVINDAVRQLKELEGDEKRNKEDIEVAGEKEAWYRELEEFIVSLSTFLDEKMPRLEEIEKDWKELLVERAETVEKARAVAMTDEACLFYGVPAKRLDPQSPRSFDEGEGEYSPALDGGALSVVRETRRAAVGLDEDGVPPAVGAMFEDSRKKIVQRLNQLLDDVKAPEFLDPAVRVESKLHPSSLVVRFHQWRALYSDEYAGAWGGLTLAGIWDFWVRKEICCWDLPKNGHHGMDEFQWNKELSKYSAAAVNGIEKEKDVDSDMVEAIGGDDEMISHILCNTIITRIIDICEAGGFDPWSTVDSKSMMNILEQISYVLERDNLRFQSTVSAFLQTFKLHIDTLIDSMTSPPDIAPPPFDPRGPPALLSFLAKVKGLLDNLLLMNRYVPSSERPFYLDLIDRLVGKLIWNLLGMAKDTGGKEVAKDILARCTRTNLLQQDVRARLAIMANGQPEM